MTKDCISLKNNWSPTERRALVVGKCAVLSDLPNILVSIILFRNCKCGNKV